MPPPLAPLTFTPELRARIDPYLSRRPSTSDPVHTSPPHTTLTYATSLDSAISLRPGTQTILSGPASKAMTHYLRTRHDAIIVGSGTAIADDPSLYSRNEDVYSLDENKSAPSGQPRPVIIDRRARWAVHAESKVVKAARDGIGKGPWVFVGQDAVVDDARRKVVEDVGGEYVRLSGDEGGHGWPAVLRHLQAKKIKSVMVEGGAEIINQILKEERNCADSVIVTIAPVYLGQGGVVVSPEKRQGEEEKAVVRFGNVMWLPLGEDVVMCGRPLQKTTS